MNVGSFVGGNSGNKVLNKNESFFFHLFFFMTPSDMRLSLMRQIIPIRRRHLY